MSKDLSVFEQSQDLAEEGQWMEIETADGEGTDMWLLLAGSDSSYHKKEINKQRDKMLKKKKMQRSSSEIENDNINLLAASTLDWKNVQYNGEELECNRENVRWLYKNFPAVQEQVDEFIGDRSNFLPS